MNLTVAQHKCDENKSIFTCSWQKRLQLRTEVHPVLVLKTDSDVAGGKCIRQFDHKQKQNPSQTKAESTSQRTTQPRYRPKKLFTRLTFSGKDLHTIVAVCLSCVLVRERIRSQQVAEDRLNEKRNSLDQITRYPSLQDTLARVSDLVTAAQHCLPAKQPTCDFAESSLAHLSNNESANKKIVLEIIRPQETSKRLLPVRTW